MIFKEFSQNNLLLKNYFSFSTIILFKRVLQRMFEKELEIEDIRQKFIKKMKNLRQTFRSLDNEEKGFLTGKDFKTILNKQILYNTSLNGL